MKNGLTPELLEQAKTATSAAELLALAAEKGLELTPAEAASYYVQLHPQSGALLDEELDNVAGGVNGCYNQTDGRLIVIGVYQCDYWVCNHCHLPQSGHYYPSVNSFCCLDNTSTTGYCEDCIHSSCESAIYYCNHPANHKSNNP